MQTQAHWPSDHGHHSIWTNQCLHSPSPIFFTGRMPFLPPNQHYQSTEDSLPKSCNIISALLVSEHCHLYASIYPSPQLLDYLAIWPVQASLLPGRRCVRTCLLRTTFWRVLDSFSTSFRRFFVVSCRLWDVFLPCLSSALCFRRLTDAVCDVLCVSRRHLLVKKTCFADFQGVFVVLSRGSV